MSIPRLAIHRPITMFMISAVILLLGTISLMRLPVDLMPDVSFPSITVRVGYAFTAVYRTPAENAIAFAAYGSRKSRSSSRGK